MGDGEMKRTFFTILFLSVCFIAWRTLVTSEYRDKPGSANAAQAMAAVPTFANTPTPRPTNTPVPPPTIDYQNTAVIAQQTADEARRVNVMVTAQYEQLALAQAQITAEHERSVMQIYSWTEQAAGTVIPLTATQQAIINTQSAMKQELAYANMTATEHVPTQMAALVNAENDAKFSKANNIARLAGTWSVIMFICAIVIFLFTHPSLKGTNYERSVEDEMEENHETAAEPRKMEIAFETRSKGGYQSSLSTLPLDEIDGPRLLDEFALAILNKEKTLAIGHWEGSKTLWNRDLYHPFRLWLRNPFNEDPKKITRAFAIADESNKLVPTPELYEFCEQWVNTRKLSDEYEFEQYTQHPQHHEDTPEEEWGREPTYHPVP